MTTITIDQQIACVKREIGMRRRVYASWVANGRMKQAAADHEIAAMEAVLATLEQVKDGLPGKQGALTL